MMRVLGGCCNRRALPAVLGCRRLRATQPIIRLMIIAQSVHCSQESLREAKVVSRGTCIQSNVAVSRPLVSVLCSLTSLTSATLLCKLSADSVYDSMNEIENAD